MDWPINELLLLAVSARHAESHFSFPSLPNEPPRQPYPRPTSHRTFHPLAGFCLKSNDGQTGNLGHITV